MDDIKDPSFEAPFVEKRGRFFIFAFFNALLKTSFFGIFGLTISSRHNREHYIMKILLWITLLTTNCFLSYAQSDTTDKNKTQKIPDGVTLTHSGYGTTITGVYNGYNIYIQNPITYKNNVTTKGCIQIYPSVNGKLTTRIVTSTSFELDLSEYGMKVGDKVIIEIRHGDCEFKILNLEVLKSGYVRKK